MLLPAVLISTSSILIPIAIATITALLLGIILVVFSRLFSLPVDQKLEDIRAALPGVNCGACGYSGCDGYAEALGEGTDTDVTKCSPGGPDTADELASLLGQSGQAFLPKVAYIHCQGTTDHTHRRFEYHGVQTCSAAHNIFSGPNSCSYGCLGFGDCKVVCPYGAIYISKGIAHIDSHLCTACGLCVAACPKDLIEIVPRHFNAYTVACKNKWPGAQTRKSCSVGCIGCRRCFKACPSDAITMDGTLAVIDPFLCTHCHKCVEVCPTDSILRGLSLAIGPEAIPLRSRQVDDPVTLAPALAAAQPAINPEQS